jgi:hypothetical protein
MRQTQRGKTQKMEEERIKIYIGREKRERGRE